MRFRYGIFKRLSCVIALLAALMSASNAPGATLVTLDLVMDGAAMPPGDRLDYTVLLTPDEKELRLEVRAFVVDDKSAAATRRVKARGQQVADALGNLLVEQSTRRSGESPVLNGHIVVPYEYLALPIGTHELAYEVTGRCQEQTVFVRPTELTRVTVSDGERREMVLREATQTSRTTKKNMIAFVPGERTRDGSVSVERKLLELTKKIAEKRDASRTVAVSIPGGFDRENIVPREPTPPAESPADTESDLAALLRIPWSPLSEVKSERERAVYFATNRQRNDSLAGVNQFTAEISPDLTYGVCTVNIPVDHHTKGRLEEPSWWKRRNPEEHFLVQAVSVLPKANWLRDVRERDVFLFVHGYKSTFERTMLRTAQLQYDLELSGRGMAFSWPSAGELLKYEQDAQRAQASESALADLLHTLTVSTDSATEGRDEKVHILAHSMGTRVLLRAIRELYTRGDVRPGVKLFGQVILAAPDMAPTDFADGLPYAVEFAERVTYYYCRKDLALAASRKVNDYQPVGSFAFFQHGLDTISADRVGTSFFNHNYYASSREVLLDTRLMVNLLLGPSERIPPLESSTKVDEFDHWAFAATTFAQKAPQSSD